MSRKRQIINQADIFYYSGHGRISDGALQSGADKFEFAPSLVQGRLDKDVDALVISGCSVLAIGKSRYDSFGLKAKLRWQYLTNRGKNSSPGINWEATGCKMLLGYCWRAPNDLNGAMSVAAIFALRVKSGEDVMEAWKVANDCPDGRNACAIDCRTIPHKYWYWSEREGLNTWTNITKEVSTSPR